MGFAKENEFVQFRAVTVRSDNRTEFPAVDIP
jgi:hypothetical protein